VRPTLTAEMARVVVEDRVEAAERFRRRQEARRAASELDRYEIVTVRLAGEQDEASMRRLAERNGSPEPHAPVLVAEAEGKLLAARSLSDGRSIADPFQHTAHLSELLELRAAHLRGARSGGPRIRERLTMAAGRLSRHTAANPNGGR
jgi:hypothetical protein